MLESFDVETFAPHLGGVFRVRVEDGVWEETRLIEATALGEGADHRLIAGSLRPSREDSARSREEPDFVGTACVRSEGKPL